MGKVAHIHTKQASLFPGMKYTRVGPDDEPPRLKVIIKIDIEDRQVGEKFNRLIILELDDSSKVCEHIKSAILHDRTLSDVDSFCEDRDGNALRIERSEEGRI